MIRACDHIGVPVIDVQVVAKLADIEYRVFIGLGVDGELGSDFIILY